MGGCFDSEIMIKRSLFFGNPAYLSTTHQQLVVSYPAEENKTDKSMPIKDVGIIVLEHHQITVTNGLVGKLLKNNAAEVTCDKQHLPTGFLQPLIGHTEQTKRISD